MDDVRWKGPESLRPLLVPLESLQPDPENARRHPRQNIEAIGLSLETFGQRKPIVAAMAAQGTVIAGNGTLEAAREKGWTHLAVVDSSDLSSEQAEAYALADNQTTDLSEWEAMKLKEALKRLPDRLKAATGFSTEAIASLSALGPVSAPRGQDGKADKAAGGGVKGILVSADQMAVIDRAVVKMRAQEGDPSMTVGRVLELLAAEYLS